MISRFLFLIFLFPFSNLFSQQAFENYTQNINGTDLHVGMVAISGGRFMMGNKDGADDQKPEHEVEVSSFWMSSHEVPWDLFEPFLAKDHEKKISLEDKVPENVDAITRPTKPYLDMTFGMGKEGFPAVGMTHYNAIQFCKWLYTRTGVFFRLPTEAEWEFVAKTGLNDDFSSNLENYAWYDANSEAKSQKIGTKAPNKLGIYDLFGNVTEWTYDQYAPDFYSSLAGSLAVNPVNTPTTLYPHVVRGGSFQSSSDLLNPTARDYSDPMWKQLDPQIPKSNWWFPEAPFVGIRLVRPLNPPSEKEILAYYDKAPIKDF